MITVSTSLFQNTSNSSQFLNMPSHAKVASNQTQGDSQSGSFVLNQALKESVGVELSRPVAPVAETFDVDAIVSNVLEFVASRVDQAAMEGASEDELQGMMDAARDGVARGFGQAREQLEELGKLDDALGAKVTEAEDNIYAGLDDLSEALFGEVEDTDVQDADVNAASLEIEQYAYRQKSSFSFEVLTQEGDRVTVSAYQAYGENSQSFNAQDGENQLAVESYSAFEAQGFQLSVDGDLNDAEMDALQSLFDQVNDLSETFYNGDLDTAFDMAMSLTSDADQIAQFSLNMRQVQTVAYQYAGYSQAGEGLPKGLAQPLQSHAQGLLEAMDTAQVFQNPFELVQGLLDNFDGSGKMEPFNSALFDALEA